MSPVSLMMTIKMQTSESAKKIAADMLDKASGSMDMMGDMMNALKLNESNDQDDDDDLKLIEKAENEIKDVDPNAWKMLTWTQSRKPSEYHLDYFKKESLIHHLHT